MWKKLYKGLGITLLLNSAIPVFAHNRILTGIKTVESPCLTYSIFALQHKDDIKNGKLYQLLESEKAIPFYITHIDYNGDGKKETIIIGELENSLFCSSECHTLSYLFYQKFLEVHTNEEKNQLLKPISIGINEWDKFICNVPLFANFYKNFNTLVCKLPIISDFLSSECNICNKQGYTLFAIDITNQKKPKVLWAIQTDTFTQSGPIVFKYNQTYYVGFTYTSKTNNLEKPYSLNLKIIPLEKLQSLNDIETITLIRSDKPLLEGKLYTKGLDWNLDGETDVLLIPYYEAEDYQATNWKSHLLAIKTGAIFSYDFIANTPLCSISDNCKDFKLNEVILTEAPIGFLYGKPYLFIGTTDTLQVSNETQVDTSVSLHNHYWQYHYRCHFHSQEPKYFYALSICGNNLCSFNNIEINPSNQVSLSVNFGNLTVTKLDEGNCKEFVKNHKNLRFTIEQNFRHSGHHMVFSHSYIENNKAIFTINSFHHGLSDGIIINLDKVLFKESWGTCLYNKEGIYCYFNQIPKHSITIPTKEGLLKISFSTQQGQVKVTISGNLNTTKNLHYEYYYKNNHSSSDTNTSSLKKGVTFEVKKNSPLQIGIEGLEPLSPSISKNSQNILLWLEF